MEDKPSKMESIPAKPTNMTQGRLTKMEENIIKMTETGSKPETGPTPPKEKSIAMGIPAGDKYFEPRSSKDEENLVREMVIDEDILEAEYQERMMKNAVTSEVVSEDKLKREGRLCRTFLCCLCIGVIFAIVLPLLVSL
jgi:hypothetical protein